MDGTGLGHFSLLEKIGEGGMGRVYRARDLRLERVVAIKLLPESRSADPAGRARFVKEAKAASALNHPNIITIHEIGEHEGQTFIVMELVEGKPLHELIPEKGMRLTEALRIAAQVAGALTAAHAAGIVHRDLKPANIMVDAHGRAKVLDFGLAKLSASAASGADTLTHTLTMEQPLTEEGAIVGSVPYMSPEQAEGKAVDARSDIFSFGAVLYEMITGQRAFRGESKISTLAAIVEKEPQPLSEISPATPHEVERLIVRCLRKDVLRRSQNMADVKLALEELRDESESGKLTTPAAAPRRRVPRMAVGAAALIVAAVLAYLFRPALPPPRVTGSSRVTNDGRTKSAMVTDGPRIYFSALSGYSASLYQVSTTGGGVVPIQTPFPAIVTDISPDRSELLVAGCAQSYQVECPLWVVPVLGRSPRRVGDIRVSDAAWSRDGREIIYAQGNSLYRAKVDGTESRKIVSVGANEIPGWPRWSPDGSRLRFSVDTQHNGTSLWEVSADGRNLHPLLSGWNNPPAECCGSWTPDGKYFIFESSRGGTRNIWAIREEGSYFRKVNHEPVPLTTGPASSYTPVPSTDGKKIFAMTAQLRGELSRYDPASHRFAPYLSGISAMGLNFSRDGKWLTYVSYPEFTLWRSNVDGSNPVQLTFPPIEVAMPRWSPDGSRIAFMGQESGKRLSIYVISAEGGSPEQVRPGERDEGDPNWSPDGNSLLFGRVIGIGATPGAGAPDLEILDLRTHQVSTLPGSSGLWSPRWSPDGRHILAISEAADRLMLFDFNTRDWTELARTVVSYPEWSGKGDYIYFPGVPTGGQPGLFRLRISDHKLQEVTSLKDFHQLVGWGGWAGLAPDDSPLLVRQAGSFDIYALDWDAR